MSSKFSFKVKQTEFIHTINFVKSIISTKNALPIIQNIVISLSDDGDVTLKATDLETTMGMKVNVESYNNYGEACVDAVKLKGIVSEISKDDIIEVIIDGSKITIKKPNGKYNLVAESTDEYPVTKLIEDTDNSIKIPVKALVSTFNKTRFAASDDEMRPAMCGVLLKIDDGKIVGAATDGHILSVCKQESEVKDVLSKAIIVPLKPIKCMEALFKGRENDIVTVTDTQSYFIVANDKFSMYIRKIEAKFPNYDAIIPKTNDKTFNCNISELKQKVKLVSMCASKGMSVITLEVIGNELKLSAEDVDFNVSGYDTLNICDKEGDDIKIKVKSSLFLASLDNISCDQTVFIEMSESNRAFLIKSDIKENFDDLILVMPFAQVD